jgi:hypothetical protein
MPARTLLQLGEPNARTDFWFRSQPQQERRFMQFLWIYSLLELRGFRWKTRVVSFPEQMSSRNRDGASACIS